MADGGAQLAELTREAVLVRMVPAPVAYSESLFSEICERVAHGETLTAICKEPGLPSLQGVYGWIEKRPDCAESYARARERQAHTFASQVIDTARNATDPQLARLQVDSLKWTASKLSPRHYGDNLQVRHADADGQKLDTGPRVAELLALMQPGANTQAPSEPIDITPRVLTRAPDRDTRASESDVSDLV